MANGRTHSQFAGISKMFLQCTTYNEHAPFGQNTKWNEGNANAENPKHILPNKQTICVVLCVSRLITLFAGNRIKSCYMWL